MFRGDVDLFVEKRPHGGIALAHRETLHFLLRRDVLQQKPVDQPASRSRAAR